MNSSLTLALAFASGLAGAGHCLGMCGGLAGGCFLHCRKRPARVLVFGYHGMRLLVYVLLGVAGALLGRVLVQNGLFGKGQGLLLMAAGALLAGLGLGRMRAGGSGSRRQRLWGETHRAVPALWAGALNGLVPCGLVFSMAVKATAEADPVRAGLLMCAFGLGTVPAMATVSGSAAVLGDRLRGRVHGRATGLAVLALGLWTLYEGWAFFAIMRGLANG